MPMASQRGMYYNGSCVGGINMPVLKTSKITKTYHGLEDDGSTKALRGIDLSIEEGEFAGVMGPSGSGKTTLLNILSGLDRPTAGLVEIGGKQISSMGKDELALFRRRKIGFVFQEFNLLDSLTIKENIALPLVLDRREPGPIERKVRELMHLFDLTDIADKYPCNTSGGQQQRTAVGRALANDPAVVFADEPTGNLDSKSSKTIMEYFEKVNERTKATILMVTHDPFAASYCKRVVFIKDGLVHMEIEKKGGRKEFFDAILDCLAVLGGERYDV